ncbi:hypothetical protein L6467_03145 [Segatella bryantii]|uniref:hypothetical protein n=1 Tax=Segatella bryantii TaxID=77095 RepID=UPI001EDA62E8|nr:hypothetical protein [Segatella bryantii]UKK72106.1 hypothetical protein L6467_03145 [Segatella bryantii]
MVFERILEGKDHLWAVRDMSKPKNELALLFDSWNDFGYLMDFFMDNLEDLKSYFHIERISDAIDDTMDDAEQLERLIRNVPTLRNSLTGSMPADSSLWTTAFLIQIVLYH